jgi:hypothetical protein
MCASDVYRLRMVPEAAPSKRLRLSDLVREDAEVEAICAIAHLEEAAECLRK